MLCCLVVLLHSKATWRAFDQSNNHDGGHTHTYQKSRTPPPPPPPPPERGEDKKEKKKGNQLRAPTASLRAAHVLQPPARPLEALVRPQLFARVNP